MVEQRTFENIKIEHINENVYCEWRKFRETLTCNDDGNPERNLKESDKIPDRTCRDYNRPPKTEMSW